MAGLADSRVGGIRPITAQDVTDGTLFRGVLNFNASAVSLQFESVPSAGTRTEDIQTGSVPFTFRAKAVPASTLYGWINYAEPS